jgi:hypothetical protein
MKKIQRTLLCSRVRAGKVGLAVSSLMLCFPVLAQTDAKEAPAPAGATENSPKSADGTAGATVETRIELPADIEADFSRFEEWIGKYTVGTPDAKTALLPAGIELAKARRTTLQKLIVSNPQAALQRAVSWKTRQLLPSSIVELLEERISGRGEFMVLIVDQVDPQTGRMRGKLLRLVTLGLKTYHAYVYGRRAGVTTKRSLPLHGIAIELNLAIHESPLRILEDGETPDPAFPVANPDKRCPITGEDASQGVIADVGGKIYYFARDADLQSWVKRIEEQENVIGPDVVAGGK